MDAVIQKNWAAALNSANYAAGSSDMLRNGDKYSALGVLIDVVDKTLWDTTKPAPHLKATALGVWTKAGITQAEMKQVCDLQKSGQTFAQIAAVVAAYK